MSKTQTTPMLYIFARRVGWSLYLFMIASASLAYWDRTGQPFLTLWLNLTALLSVVLVVILAVIFAFNADRIYTNVVQDSGDSLRVLGGGLVLTVILLLPVLNAAEVLKQRPADSSIIPLGVFLAVWIGMLVANLMALRVPSVTWHGPRPLIAVLMAPYLVILSLWFVWLLNTAWLYLQMGNDGGWLKTGCIAFILTYAALLGYSAIRLPALFRND